MMDSSIVTVIKGLFADKLLNDNRVAILTFSIPFGLNEEEFGLFAPQFEPWKQLIYLVALQIPLQCIFAGIIYALIIKKRGTTSAYLLGWGVIIPTCCVLPFWILDVLDIRNKNVSLAGANLFSIVGFKCIEAMYGTPPSPAVETSVYHYMAYYTTLVPFVWDSKTNSRTKVKRMELIYTILWLFVLFHVYSLFLSYMIYHNYKPFKGDDDNVQLDQWNLTLDLISPSHMVNGYLMCVLTFCNLALGFGLTALGNKLQGYSTEPIFINPLFASRTPTEFWTKRWNIMVHRLLKYGVFFPAKRIVQSSQLSLLITFVVSGLYHDYAWLVNFYNTQHNNCNDDTCHEYHTPLFGTKTLFFLTTGLIMLLERPVSKLPVVTTLAEKLPTFIISTLMVLVHVPVSHWYYGDWVVGGYFNQMAVGLWHIKKV